MYLRRVPKTSTGPGSLDWFTQDKYRPRLAAFLRLGIGLSATWQDFDRCMEIGRPELEREWNSWVRQQRR